MGAYIMDVMPLLYGLFLGTILIAGCAIYGAMKDLKRVESKHPINPKPRILG